jgi:Pilin (bacterial filament)
MRTELKPRFVSFLLAYPAVWVIVALAIAIALGINSSRNSAFDNSRVREMISAARAIQAQASNFITMNDRLPVSAAELGYPEGIGQSDQARSRTTFALHADGSIVVTGAPGSGSLSGKSIVLTPAFDGERLVWQCASPDISETLLPESCRKPTQRTD